MLFAELVRNWQLLTPETLCHSKVFDPYRQNTESAWFQMVPERFLGAHLGNGPIWQDMKNVSRRRQPLIFYRTIHTNPS